MDDLVKLITDAEQNAAAIKSEAVTRAGKIIEEAREKAAQIEAQAAQSCVEYRDECLKNAKNQAEQDYKESILKSRKDAAEYAENIARNTDVTVGKIVGRVSGGNS